MTRYLRFYLIFNLKLLQSDARELDDQRDKYFSVPDIYFQLQIAWIEFSQEVGSNCIIFEDEQEIWRTNWGGWEWLSFDWPIVHDSLLNWTLTQDNRKYNLINIIRLIYHVITGNKFTVIIILYPIIRLITFFMLIHSFNDQFKDLFIP